MESNYPPAADRITSDIEALACLNEVGNRCARAGSDFGAGLEAILDAAIFLTGADKGDLRFVDPATDGLVIRALRGFGDRSLQSYPQLDNEIAAACVAARKSAARVILEDVGRSELFARSASLDALLAEGVRAVHSTPIRSSDHVLGVISTYFIRPTRQTERVCGFMDLLARQTADYVERRGMERQLAARRLQLERITGQVGAAIIECSRDLRYVFVNKACADFLGKPVERIVGRSIPKVIGEAAFQVIRPYVDRVLAGERVEYESEIPYAEIGSRHMHVIYVPELDEQGAVCGWIATINDMTDQRRLEEELRRADRQKDEFLAMLAHELRNPLAPIRYALAAARKSDAPEHRARVQEVTERQVAHMSRLLDDLLEASRITLGKLELKKSPTELTSVLTDAIEAARPFLDAKSHTVSLDLEKSLVRIDGDADRLTQVFSNLLINAAKYTDSGGQINVRARVESGNVLVSVCDNDIGVSKELMPRLLQLFAQGSTAGDHSEGGLGVGLGLARGIVELHGGRLEVSSDGLNRGSEFTVRLPIGPELEKKDVRIEPAPAPAHAVRSRLKILVADDNRDVADTCASLLQLSGHYVQIAYSGLGALELAEAFRPHALILDIGMSDLNGYELAERIRAAVWGKCALLVAISGWGREEDRGRAFAAGFDHHLTKPITGSVLEVLLESAGGAPTAF